MQKKFFLIIGICAIILASYFGYVLADSQGDTLSFNPFVSQDIKRIAHINNEFSLDFYSQLAKNTDENIFFSPTSMLTAFAILYEGAEGNTAAQMQDVFGFEPDESARRDAFAKMQEFLNPQDGQYNLRLANGLWLAHDFEPLPEYVNTVETYYDSKLESLDFSSDSGAKTINDWVSEKTEGKIENLFGGLPPGTRMVIANAIYFKGTWMHQFDAQRTSDRAFYITEDESIQVPTMHLPRINPLPYARNEQMAMLELPYEGDDVSMLILLPHDVNGLKSLEDSLTAKNLEQWRGELEEIHISVSLPKFTLETDYNLNGYLSEMGMPDAFSGASADFGKISGSGGLFVGQAVHKAYIDVNEEGTEAAASTGIAMLQSGFTFYADHPFLFIIQDNKTGQILFIGRIMDPTK